MSRAAEDLARWRASLAARARLVPLAASDRACALPRKAAWQHVARMGTPRLLRGAAPAERVRARFWAAYDADPAFARGAPVFLSVSGSAAPWLLVSLPRGLAVESVLGDSPGEPAFVILDLHATSLLAWDSDEYEHVLTRGRVLGGRVLDVR